MQMAAPVAFNDIGKSTKDLLFKDYPIGGVKLEVKTTAPNGVTFKVNGHRDNKTGIIIGDLETKYADKANGFSLTEAWTTSNHLNGKLELEDNVAKGLKLELLTSLLPASHEKNAKINAIYKQPNVHTIATLDVFKSNVIVNSVVGQQGFFVGGEVAYNVVDGKVSRYHAAAEFNAADYSVALVANNNWNVWTASYHHRVTSDLEASGKATWDPTKSDKVDLQVGAKLQLDDSASIKSKISNTGILGVAYTQSLRQGVKINLGASIDTARLDENAHKLGIAFILEN